MMIKYARKDGLLFDTEEDAIENMWENTDTLSLYNCMPWDDDLIERVLKWAMSQETFEDNFHSEVDNARGIFFSENYSEIDLDDYNVIWGESNE